MKAHITPYLNFNGQCKTALTFYQECFGGQLTLQKVAESPMAVHMPSEAGDQILHGKLKADGIIIMGSDMIGRSLLKGNGIALCLNCVTDAEIHRYFEKLSQGGEVKMPLHQTFWGATYGELIDKFEIPWMFNLSRS